MPTPPARSSDDEIEDLPLLDGDGEGEATDSLALDALELADDGGDALDDRTGEDDPIDDDDEIGGVETGWLEGAEDADGLDVGAFDLSLSAEQSLLGDDEPDEPLGGEDLGTLEENLTADSGEEGPLADDEELREEDLPELDADDGGEVDDEALFERSALADQEELRWDDRAWARVQEALAASDEADDSGMLPVPGDDPGSALRDAAWKALDQSGRVMAAAFVPGGSVVVALESAARPLLVRILPDGATRIIAEVEIAEAEPTSGEQAAVTSLRWDAQRGWLVASGTFGVQAFRPV